MKKRLLLVFALTLILSMPTSAEGSSGNKPLFLDTASPEDGAGDIPLDQEIKLVFSKNVVNLSVKENNMECFSMEDSEGRDVPMEVVMGDDQIHPDEKRNISLKPVAGLLENTTYTIRISPDLLAKNGNRLGEETTLSFSTVSTKAPASSFNTPIIALAAVLIGLSAVLISKRKSQ